MDGWIIAVVPLLDSKPFGIALLLAGITFSSIALCIVGV